MRRAIGAVGRALVTLGLLILLFVAYQLWGTGIYEAREQSRLKSEFQHALAKATTATTTTTAPSTPTTVPPPPQPAGDAIAVIRIPKLGVEDAVVQGIDVPDLRKGPGHYPLSPLPGQLGNAAIAGHRTTYGAPFNRVDELRKGDVVAITTLAGTYRYKLDRDPFTVKPTQIEVLVPTPDPAQPGRFVATLTLTTCNPKYSAAERLIVKATLDLTRSPPPGPSAPTRGARSLSGAGLSGAKESRLPTIWWGLAVAAVGALWWLLFHRYRRWTTWFAGGLPFLVVLFFFYAHLERLLPGNY
jgi:sortase A